ncbi:MAG: N-acetylglucosamine-6-phosphate deacetylase [Saprospiraceae bacterium]
MNKIKIVNGRLITPFRIIENGSILIENGKIVYIGNEQKGDSGHIIDAQNHYVSPGFIDLHIHGGGGYDFMDGTTEAFHAIAQIHALHGTTSMVPTTLTAETDDLLHILSTYKKANEENKQGSRFLGIHIEGPYFALNQRGAQDPRYIRKPHKSEYEKIISHSDDIIRWSAAPEIEGVMEFARYIRGHNILPCIAHSDATSDDIIEALENGFTHVTHLYSAMSGVTRRNAYRYAGIIESSFLYDQLTVEIIADGSHLPASLLQLIYKHKGPSRISLITDAMRAAGTSVTESILGSMKDGLKVIVENGVAKLPDRSSFAGSVATADQLVQNMIKLGGVPLLQAVQMMTLTPATISKVDQRIGSLSAGKDADIIIFDEEISIKSTIIQGEVIKNIL